MTLLVLESFPAVIPVSCVLVRRAVVGGNSVSIGLGRCVVEISLLGSGGLCCGFSKSQAKVVDYHFSSCAPLTIFVLMTSC